MIAILATALLASTSASDRLHVQQTSEAIVVQAMDEQRFWVIMDRAAVHKSDPDRQVASLRSELETLTAEEVLAFRSAFEVQLARAYTWDLWAVAYVAHGGASDDGFEYFRRWMVSRGRAAFERLLAHPDDLADMVAADADGVLEFEEILYVTDEVWSERTGLDPAEMPIQMESTTLGREPLGVPFEDDPDHLERRVPKTWARFGDRPLG
ncbi:MAG: DUF4240 domain-containing protein [Brevundimonas sp.]|uniref:DUF4240 domain-containing protein n=1 Tax=Brevundimonas sp. TaxID=1871086 RepID=UPI00391C0815